MHSDKTIAVVVPAYNEETLIEQTLISIPDFVDKVIVVNDAGNDHTGQVVKKIAQKDTRIILIQHEVNQGVGGAIVTGYKKAVELEIDITVIAQ